MPFHLENISSLSGSDSSDDAEDMMRGDPLKDGDGHLGASPRPKRGQRGQAQGSPLLYFRTATDHIYGVYSSVLHHPKVQKDYQYDAVRSVCQYICVPCSECMCMYCLSVCSARYVLQLHS